MALAVLGKGIHALPLHSTNSVHTYIIFCCIIESLDDLEKMVVELFMAVQNKNVTSPCWNEHPFTEEEKKICAYVVPIKDVRTLNLVFPTPDLLEYYKSSVITFLFKINKKITPWIQ